MKSKEDSGSKIDFEEIQESADEESIVNIDTQQKVVTPVKPDDISLPIRKTSGKVSKPPQFYYGFHIKEDKISDSTLSELNEPANYKEAMASPEAAMWKEAMKSEIQSCMTTKFRILLTLHPVLRRWDEVDLQEEDKHVAFHDYKIWQMDVKTTFLNQKLTEDVFMAQLEGFENAKYPKRVCKLQKAIYGLKQASHSWNLCFHKKVTQFGFSRSKYESCIYVKVSGNWLGKCFSMKDLGDAAYILGIKIYRDRSKHLIGLSQDTYLDKILKRFKMENSKKGNLPLHHGIKISKDLCLMSPLLWAWFLVYGGEEELGVIGYYDANWQTHKDDSRSQSGWVFLLNGGAVTWKSLKQATVADSTCNSEYIAACEASKEVIWMKNFIGDLGVVLTVQDLIEIFCDNESAVALTNPRIRESQSILK
ncbi:putative RNA-directed DNA polymerase [Tanacetum coccineum]